MDGDAFDDHLWVNHLGIVVARCKSAFLCTLISGGMHNVPMNRRSRANYERLTLPCCRIMVGFSSKPSQPPSLGISIGASILLHAPSDRGLPVGLLNVSPQLIDTMNSVHAGREGKARLGTLTGQLTLSYDIGHLLNHDGQQHASTERT